MLISVIVPVYKVEDTLERAVESIRQQSYKNIEIILVDDGSPDSSGAIADSIASKDSRVRVIHKENGGLSSARNAGIDIAKGEFIAFLDSDDEFDLTIMDLFISLYKKHQMDLFVFNLERIYLEDHSKQQKNAINAKFENSCEALQALFKYDGLNFYAWNKIYHRSLFEGVRYPEGKIYEDGRVSYLTTLKAEKIITTHTVGINYYENQNSIVAQDFNPRQMDNVTERIWMLEDMLKKDLHPDLISLASERLFDGLLSTAFKLSKNRQANETKKYDKELQKIAKDYGEVFKKSSDISQTKKIAWQIYKINKRLYSYLYYYYTR